jgi:hypothetical protein
MVLDYRETAMYAGPCFAMRTYLGLEQGADSLNSVFPIRHWLVIFELSCERHHQALMAAVLTNVA